MIVTCTSCQTRFRIPDDKIGSRGARVRCSKCKNVFMAKPGPAGERAPAPQDPFAAPAPGPFGIPAPDPFAAPPDDPFATSGAAPADPFGAAPDDPFAVAPPPGGSAGAVPLPVTDLADLAAPPRGAVPATRGGLTALAPPIPAPAETGPVANADDLVLEEPSRAISMAPPPLPSTAPAFDFSPAGELAEPASAEGEGQAPQFELGMPGTDLGEQPGAWAKSGLELGSSADGMAGGADFAAADPFASAAAAEPPAPLADLIEGAAARPRTITEPITRVQAPPMAPASPTAAERLKAALAPRAGPLSAPSPRGRLQAFVANAISLAALLAVAAGLLSWWLRGSAGPDGAGGRSVEAVGTRSGLYETPTGRQVLFVRGQIRSRSAVPLGRVVVRAEVLRSGEVLARAEGLAGAEPTPEEVVRLANREDAARLRAQVASRAPARLAPGRSLPFLVVFDEVPEDLPDAAFRVVAEPQRGGPARAP